MSNSHPPVPALLMDYFAAHAPDPPDYERYPLMSGTIEENRAKWAYSYAQALIEERKRVYTAIRSNNANERK